MDARAGGAAGVFAHDAADPAELLGRQVAARHLDLDGREALLPLALDVGLHEARELTVVSVRRSEGLRLRRRIGLFVVLEQDPFQAEVALVDPIALELLLHEGPELVDSDLVDQDLDPGAGPVDAQPILAVEDPHARLGDLQIVAVVELDEVVQGGRQAGHDRGTASYPHLHAANALVVHFRNERDVVDPSNRVVLVGRRERRLDLTRHRLRRRVADEIANVRARVRRDVELLALERACARVAGDVAHRVPAALAARESRVPELADQLGGIGQRDVVHLDVLPGGDVPFTERHVLLDDVGERVELIGRDSAERELDPDHLHVGLALAVDALLQAELDELVALEVALAGSGWIRCRSRRTRARGWG